MRIADTTDGSKAAVGLEPLESRQLLSITFGLPTEVLTHGTTTAALVVDLNLDHAPDLVVADGAGVGVYLNVGGHLGPRTQVSLGTDPALADIDGDGIIDLFVRSGNSVRAFRNDGHGVMSLMGTMDEFGTPSWFADLNGDGRADMITGRRERGPAAPTLLVIRFGDGIGGFGPAQDQNRGPLLLPGTLAVADVNGDGHPDLITENAVLLNDGLGQFSTDRRTMFTSADFPTVIAADFNGDGRTDWAVQSPAVRVSNGVLVTGRLLVYTNTTPAGGPVSFSLASFDNPSPTKSITAADFNGDGRLDVLLSGFLSPIGGTTPPNPDSMGELYINDGAGGFERASIPRVGPAPQDTAAWQTLPAAIDLSGNGQISVIAARPGVLGIFSPGAAPVAPQIASISFSPPKATFGHQITILANGVSVQGSTVSSVRFYRDSNGNGVRDARDQFLGADTSSRGGWSLSTRVSSSWGAGYTTVFAVATDALGRRGETFASVQSVPQTPPTIGDLSITQYTGWWSMYRLGPMAVLKAIDVADVDGPVKEVSFYRDVNFNNRVDSADQFLGSAREGAGFQIKVRLKTNWWVNLGTQIKFVARARDQDNQIGTAVSLLVTR